MSLASVPLVAAPAPARPELADWGSVSSSMEHVLDAALLSSATLNPTPQAGSYSRLPGQECSGQHLPHSELEKNPPLLLPKATAPAICHCEACQLDGLFVCKGL